MSLQLHGELDELHRQLEARRGQYGSSLSNVVMTSQAFKQFELTVQVSTAVLSDTSRQNFVVILLERKCRPGGDSVTGKIVPCTQQYPAVPCSRRGALQ